jgi:hypothetical protein
VTRRFYHLPLNHGLLFVLRKKFSPLAKSGVSEPTNVVAKPVTFAIFVPFPASLVAGVICRARF